MEQFWTGILALIGTGLLGLGTWGGRKVIAKIGEYLQKTTSAQTQDISALVEKKLEPLGANVRASRIDVQLLRVDFQDHRDSLGRAHDELSRRVDGVRDDGKKTGEALKKVETDVQALVVRVDKLEEKGDPNKVT